MDEDLVIANTAAHVKACLLNEPSGHDWWHIYRVWQLARFIAEQEQANRLIVELAALLHDIADWKMHGGDLEAGPRAARAWLTPLAVSESAIVAVEDILRTVSFKGAGVKTPMSTIEGKVVQDADRLDAIGAVGIARAFTYGGHVGQPLHDPDRQVQLHGSFAEYKNNRSTTINHFHEQLLLLKDRMNTDAGKKLAQKRHDFMQTYMDNFQREWSGQI